MSMESGQVLESGSLGSKATGTDRIVGEPLELGASIPKALIEALLKAGGESVSLIPEPIRIKVAELLAEEKLPDESSELWRQTSLDLFPFDSLGAPSARVEVLPSILSAADATERGANASGALALKSELPAGVEWVPCEALSTKDFQDLLLVFKNAYTEVQHDAVSRLLLLCSRGGGVLRVRAGTKVTQPICLSIRLPPTTGGATQAAFIAPTVAVIVERGASCVLLEDLRVIQAGVNSEGQNRWITGGLVAPRLEALVEENAQAELLSVQRLPAPCAYLGRHRFQLKRDAQLHTTHVALGAGVARVELECSLIDTGARADLYSLYLADGQRHVDFHTTQAHRAPHCYSNLYCKGAVTDAARSVYYGFIRVAEGAQKTDAYQKNRNLLLSEKARSDAIPNLEILANDVKCSHGASVGQVGADELFYLMSRGINRTDAEQILVQAFFEDVVAKVENPFAREYVDQVVGAAFGARAEKWRRVRPT
jgi:Fe-S cluster assembly protein SufD